MKKRPQVIEKSIRAVWDSLESHLQYTYLKTKEGKQFHKKCVKEYALLIKWLSELY